MERVFSLDEARALLPALTKLLAALEAAHRELVDIAPGQGQRISSGNGSAAAASSLSAAEQRYMDLLRELDGMGVVVRDPQTGLVDFPATREGDSVYLCWRLGEPDIAFWHPHDTGIAGRQPL